MSNLELCKLLISPLDGTQMQSDCISVKVNEAYTQRLKKVKGYNRSTDPEPGLDKMNFKMLQDVMHRMKF